MNQPHVKESNQDLDMVSQELQLTRTILERLECSFTRQEAKLDKLMAMLPTAPQTEGSGGGAYFKFWPIGGALIKWGGAGNSRIYGIA